MPSRNGSKGIVLNANRLIDLLNYEAATGVFRWRVTNRRARAGVEAGTIHWKGYRDIIVDGNHFLAHRLVWMYIYGHWPIDQIDHINGNRLDNRLVNLREATNTQNQQNQRRPRSDNKSGFLGVSPSGNNRSPWRAQIAHHGRKIYLGEFTTKEDAHTAYLTAKQHLHPFQTIVTANAR